MAEKENKSGVAEPSKSSTEQSAKTHLPLSQLNDASNKSGNTWLVDCFCPFNDKYEYEWQKKMRNGENFVVTLICAQDPTN